MSSSLDVQDLILQTLKDTPSIMDLVNGVWDQPPATCWNTPKEAYISFAGSDTTEDGADCAEGGIEINVQLDVWSRKVGFPNCKQITDLVRKALHNQDLVLPGDTALVQMWVPLTKVERDPDGTTTHGVVIVTATIEEA